jgi:hypothetical protein
VKPASRQTHLLRNAAFVTPEITNLVSAAAAKGSSVLAGP